MRTLLMLLLAGPAFAAEPGKFDTELKTILAVSKEGAGNDTAAKSWSKLVSAGVEALVPTLDAFQTASPTSANWLRTAVDAIAEAERKAKRPLNAELLKSYILETKKHPTARRIAYELLNQQDPPDALALLGSFKDDPNLELRRDAIQHELTRLAKVAEPTMELKNLFQSARDKDQIESIANLLKEKKVPTDITKHLGYVTQWHVVGPFANTNGEGYTTTCEPEQGVTLTAKYKGSHTKEDKAWIETQSHATYGTIDLNTTLGKHKDALAYAYATIVAEKETAAEVRVASQNAVKIYFNGKEVFAREEYHHGTRMDQHTARITLNKGKNTIMLKVCQNDQPHSWAQAWGFAARICDATGGSLPIKQEFNGAAIDLGALKSAPPEPKESKKEKQ